MKEQRKKLRNEKMWAERLEADKPPPIHIEAIRDRVVCIAHGSSEYMAVHQDSRYQPNREKDLEFVDSPLGH